ncbi:MAG: right-handed parallel beta-helix repeat-containing protein [Nitrospirae bacterium]|nr:right-handed parallel beta-helix repeat-containing protein [Nitrospirota bacterium]
MNIQHSAFNVQRFALSAVLCVLIFSLAACTADVQTIGKITLEKDTVWSGSILIDGDIYVPPGTTLTIKPGTMVKFKRIDADSGRNLFETDSPYYPQAEIIVRGKIIARGTKDKPIVFTSSEVTASPADWGAINLLGSRDNVFEHCKVLCAYNGIHAHSSSALISHSEFMKNGVAITYKKEYEFPNLPWFDQECDVVITHNLIHKNKGGISFRASKTRISNNEIRDNKFFGVWAKEESSGTVSYNEILENGKNIFLYQIKGVKIEFNNIYDGREYDIAIAEEQDTDVQIGNNWLGTGNREKIEEMVFDKMDDPELSRIIYEPLLKSSVKEAGL